MVFDRPGLSTYSTTMGRPLFFPSFTLDLASSTKSIGLTQPRGGLAATEALLGAFSTLSLL
jgi:hypothetical protein